MAGAGQWASPRGARDGAIAPGARGTHTSAAELLAAELAAELAASRRDAQLGAGPAVDGAGGGAGAAGDAATELGSCTAVETLNLRECRRPDDAAPGDCDRLREVIREEFDKLGDRLRADLCGQVHSALKEGLAAGRLHVAPSVGEYKPFNVERIVSHGVDRIKTHGVDRLVSLAPLPIQSRSPIPDSPKTCMRSEPSRMSTYSKAAGGGAHVWTMRHRRSYMGQELSHQMREQDYYMRSSSFLQQAKNGASAVAKLFSQSWGKYLGRNRIWAIGAPEVGDSPKAQTPKSERSCRSTPEHKHQACDTPKGAGAVVCAVVRALSPISQVSHHVSVPMAPTLSESQHFGDRRRKTASHCQLAPAPEAELPGQGDEEVDDGYGMGKASPKKDQRSDSNLKRPRLLKTLRNAASMEKTERAMGLTPARTQDLDMYCLQTAHSTPRRLATSLVSSSMFEFTIQVAIFANAVQVGLQADSMASSLSMKVPPVHRAMNVFFCALFTFEVALKLYVFRKQFFTMWGCGWNVFDMMLVIVQLTEEVMQACEDEGELPSPGMPNNMVVRIGRLMRVVKVVRIMRLMRYFEDLRLLVTCILHSAKPFFWSAALLLLIIYVVGTYLTHIVLVHRIVEGASDPNNTAVALNRYYGTVSASVLSLFQGLTGGIDWRDLLDPLLEHPSLRWAAVGFLCYFAFAILGVMNVVTGTFVQHAIERSQEVKEVNRVCQARKLFKSLDFDASGSISFEEIHDHLHTPTVQEFLRQIDVDVSEARCLFEVMDMSGSGSIDFEEFLSACLRLQGPARALDLILLTRDSRRFAEQQASLLEEVLQVLQGGSRPGTPGPSSWGGGGGGSGPGGGGPEKWAETVEAPVNAMESHAAGQREERSLVAESC